MNRLKSVGLMTALMLSLAACAPFRLVPAGDYAVGKTTRTTLDRNWADISGLMPNQPRTVKLLSIDGHLLNRLYLSDGIASGEPFVRPQRRREATTPVFRPDMSLSEQVEFITDSMAALDYQRVTTSGIKPVEVAGIRGVRFELQAATTEGLEIRGIGQAVVKNERLHLAVYLAPAEHYFAATRGSAEAAMDSLIF